MDNAGEPSVAPRCERKQYFAHTQCWGPLDLHHHHDYGGGGDGYVDDGYDDEEYDGDHDYDHDHDVDVQVRLVDYGVSCTLAHEEERRRSRVGKK